MYFMIYFYVKRKKYFDSDFALFPQGDNVVCQRLLLCAVI